MKDGLNELQTGDPEKQKKIIKPNTTWQDDMNGWDVWMQKAKDRRRWREIGKAFTQQWVDIDL